jgi:hypothetical protein
MKDEPKDDLVGNTTPLIRGHYYPDATSNEGRPIGLTMSVGLARLLRAILKEHHTVKTIFFEDCLGQAIALAEKDEDARQ